MLPLATSEIGAPCRIELGSNGGHDINCDGVNVFVMDRAKLSRGCGGQESAAGVDWLENATSVFDFVDHRSEKPADGMLALLCSCSHAISADGPEMDDEVVSAIVRIMYARPAVATLCRRIIAKGVRDRERVLPLWVREIQRCIAGEDVSAESWQLLWRDVALLPMGLKDEVMATMWQSAPQFSGVWTVVSAFQTK